MSALLQSMSRPLFPHYTLVDKKMGSFQFPLWFYNVPFEVDEEVMLHHKGLLIFFSLALYLLVFFCLFLSFILCGNQES